MTILIFTLLVLGVEIILTVYGDIFLRHTFTWVTLVHLAGLALLIASAKQIRREHALKLKDLQSRIDLTERESTENKKVFAAVLNNIPCTIAMISPNYRILSINAEVVRLTGMEQEAAIGKRCFDLFGPGKICQDCPVKKALESGKIQQNLKVEKNRENTEKYIEQLAIPILNAAGNAEYALEFVVDATEKVRLQRQHDSLFRQTIRALVQLIESRDLYTGFHSNRVRDIAETIGLELQMSEAQRNELSFAAALHDIGKIGIPEHILNKPGKLTEEEYQIIKQHPAIGYSALKDIDSLKTIAGIILDHHERVDGKGYPAGKKAAEISLAAKILSVADAYEALTADRVYRKAMTEESALKIIKDGSGTQFDPAVVEAFLNMRLRKKQ
jgi:PAS domain S-box-containing protein